MRDIGAIQWQTRPGFMGPVLAVSLQLSCKSLRPIPQDQHTWAFTRRSVSLPEPLNEAFWSVLPG